MYTSTIDAVLEDFFEESILCDQALEEFMNEYPEVATEGANLDMQKALKAAKKEFKSAMSDAKSAIADDDASKFKSAIERGKKCLDKYGKEVDDIAKDSGVGSAVLAYFFGDLKTITADVITVAAAAAGQGAHVLNLTKSINEGKEPSKAGLTATGVGAGVSHLANLASVINRLRGGILTIIALIKKFRDKEEINASDFNYIVNTTKSTLATLKKELTKIEAEGLAKIKSDSSREDSRESRDEARESTSLDSIFDKLF